MTFLTMEKLLKIATIISFKLLILLKVLNGRMILIVLKDFRFAPLCILDKTPEITIMKSIMFQLSFR
jgi:hypothetical protein